jgi:CXXX repeat peptide maturase
MLEHIVVVLDRAAVSFCHYENDVPVDGVSGLMREDLLASVVDYARANSLGLNVLFGRRPAPPEHVRLLDGISHVKIVPYELRSAYPDAVLVLDWEGAAGGDQGDRRFDNHIENLIVRVSRHRLEDLRVILRTFDKCATRINIVLKDVAQLTEADFLAYERQLAAILPLVAEWYLEGRPLELSCLSDRLLLRAMKNCDAGVRHVTFAPDGRFHICPGFYHHQPGMSIGAPGEGIRVPNPELLSLAHAPICSRCDAYQCRRCVYLNKTLTGELNTPSRQQCVTSHLERNASRRLLRRLKPHIENLDEVAEIPEIDYLDPLEVLWPDRPHERIRLYRMERGT